jgi:cysteine-rich repeat protein
MDRGSPHKHALWLGIIATAVFVALLVTVELGSTTAFTKRTFTKRRAAPPSSFSSSDPWAVLRAKARPRGGVRVTPRQLTSQRHASEIPEPPRSIARPPSALVCGNGLVIEEGCDDANTVSGDGCSATCTVESGYYCRRQPSVCATRCGDGVIAGKERCDDGNDVWGDGCGRDCRVEMEYRCSSAPSVCTRIR